MKALYSKNDYREGRLNLLPPGKAFDLEKDRTDGDVYLALDGLAEEDTREDARIHALIEESDPTSALETIKDWERSNGLVSPSAPTLQGRRQKVLQALLGVRASTQPPIEFIAQSFGYTLTAISHDDALNWSFQRGQNDVGARLYNLNYNHLLILNIEGAPLGGDFAFEAQIHAVALSHLTIRFVYE